MPAIGRLFGRRFTIGSDRDIKRHKIVRAATRFPAAPAEFSPAVLATTRLRCDGGAGSHPAVTALG
jgi:hypothetical protein